MNCEECEYYKYCTELNYLNLADECGDTYKFVSEIRADAIEELKTELIDIIYGNEEFIDWQKQEIILCLECAIENLKEQNNDN